MRSLRQWLAALGAGSFHKQLTTALVLGTICVSLLSSIAISWFVASNLRENFVRQGLRVAQTFAHQSVLSLAYGSPENAEEAVIATIAFPDVAAVEIVDLQGKILVKRAAKAAKLPAARPVAIQAEAPVVELDTPASWSILAPVFAGSASDAADRHSQASPSGSGLARFGCMLSKGTLQRMTRDIFRVQRHYFAGMCGWLHLSAASFDSTAHPSAARVSRNHAVGRPRRASIACVLGRSAGSGRYGASVQQYDASAGGARARAVGSARSSFGKRSRESWSLPRALVTKSARP